MTKQGFHIAAYAAEKLKRICALCGRSFGSAAARTNHQKECHADGKHRDIA